MKKTLITAAFLGLPLVANAALPDTPVPFKSGAGVIADGVIYIGLGTAGQNWYSLDTKAENPTWNEIQAFPGQPRDQAQAVVLDNKIYVFGGMGKKDASASVISVRNEVYCYDIANNSWEQVMTRSPLGLGGHAAVTIDGQNAIFVGSVNKAIFDGFFEDTEACKNDKQALAAINAAYVGKKTQDYFFMADILAYNAKANAWSNLGRSPNKGTAGSALAVNDDGTVTVIGGEIKPGLRTAKTLQFNVDKYGVISFTQTPDMVAPHNESVQEGVAGAFAGSIDNVVVVAGGANFPGSTQAYAQGKNFAHEGKTKTWRDEIYTYANGEWNEVGSLPLPLGYGVTIDNGDELLLIGGETTNGVATSKIYSIKLQDGKVAVSQ